MRRQIDIGSKIYHLNHEGLLLEMTEQEVCNSVRIVPDIQVLLQLGLVTELDFFWGCGASQHWGALLGNLTLPQLQLSSKEGGGRSCSRAGTKSLSGQGWRGV